MGSGKTVLVIEDDPVNMRLVTVLLEMAGYVVLAAEGAERGIELAMTEAPSLILMDISLPGMDGMEATARLKSDERTSHIPVVALTAHAMAGDRERFLKAGCDGYVAKPFNTRMLLETVAGFLGWDPESDGRDGVP